MTIHSIASKIIPILEQNGKNLHADIEDPKARLTALFDEMNSLATESQDFIELTRICHILGSSDIEGNLKAQTSKISELAQKNLQKTHTTVLSQKALEKAPLGYFEFLKSMQDLLSDNPSVLVKRSTEASNDSLLLKVDLDSLTEIFVNHFSPPTISRRLLSVVMQILSPLLTYFGQAKPKSKDIPSLTKEILKDLLLFMKYGEVPDFSSLERDNPADIQLLFYIVNYLGLDDFQKAHLEPFNEKFPKIPLSQAPRTVLSLSCFGLDVRSLDFAGLAELFPHLEKFDFPDDPGFSIAQMNQIPASLKVLKMNGFYVTDFDFSRFKNLEKLDLSSAQNLTPEQISKISTSVKVLKLKGCDVAGVDFSRFKNLEELDLSYAHNLTPEQISKIPPTVKVLKLKGCDVAGVNFSRFKNLEELDLSSAQNLIPAQINQISTSVKVLKLWGCNNVAGVDFSRLTHLKELDLSHAQNLTPEQINAIPVSIKRLKLDECNVDGVDFSRFENLEELDLSRVKNLTLAQINAIPVSIKVLKLRRCDVAGVDFPRLTNLKELDLSETNCLPEQVSKILGSLEVLHLGGDCILTKEILKEIFLFINYKKVPDLSFLNKKDPRAVDLLFIAVRYFKLGDFQKKYLEPFNKKFPEIPLSQAPTTILSLDFEEDVKSIYFANEDVSSVDFSRFRYIEEIYLLSAQNLTPEQRAQLPPGCEVIEYK